jgi:pilus assembly protein FimV
MDGGGSGCPGPAHALGNALEQRSMKAGRFALTAVALAAGCLIGSSAWPLGLGRLQVQSALGEPLRAEIDVTSLTPDEASTMNLRVASPDAYRAAGVEFNSALAGAQVLLQRHADGRPFLRVSSDRPLLEPFVDVIVEATWSTGRLVREYTVLLDPPTRQALAADAHGAGRALPRRRRRRRRRPRRSLPPQPRPRPQAPAAAPPTPAPAAARPTEAAPSRATASAGDEVPRALR